jgi:hypothetical protein
MTHKSTEGESCSRKESLSTKTCERTQRTASRLMSEDGSGDGVNRVRQIIDVFDDLKGWLHEEVILQIFTSLELRAT